MIEPHKIIGSDKNVYYAAPSSDKKFWPWDHMKPGDVMEFDDQYQYSAAIADVKFEPKGTFECRCNRKRGCFHSGTIRRIA